jgi:hypothetical protein
MIAFSGYKNSTRSMTHSAQGIGINGIIIMNLLCCQTVEDSPWTEGPNVKVVYEDEGFTNMYRGLIKMEEWSVAITPTFTPFDHAVLYTGYSEKSF